MTFIAANSLLLLTIASNSLHDLNCDETVYADRFREGLPVVVEEEDISSQSPLLGGKLVCRVDLDYSTFDHNVKSRLEEGVFEELKYRVWFSDGSGVIQGRPENTLERSKYGASETGNWAIACQTDRINDTHLCELSQDGFRIGVLGDGSYFAQVGNSHYPGTQVVVRIDSLDPITADEDSGFRADSADEIIQQLKEGNSILTRYQEWPYERFIDRQFEVYKFEVAWNILLTIYESFD